MVVVMTMMITIMVMKMMLEKHKIPLNVTISKAYQLFKFLSLIIFLNKENIYNFSKTVKAAEQFIFISVRKAELLMLKLKV